MSENRSAARMAEDQPFNIDPVIPSGEPYPEAAQRDFRGYVILIIFFMVALGIGLQIWIVSRLRSRDIVFAPEAAKVGVANGREATDWEIMQVLKLLATRLETWSPRTASTIWQEVTPYIHPSKHQSIKEQYEALSRRAESLWQHHVAMPLGVAVAGVTKTGVRRYAIFYLVAELTGKDVRTRKFDDLRQKAVYCEVVQDTSSKDNPNGILVTYWKPYEREDWLKAGFPDMWDTFEKPEPPKKEGAKK